MTHTEKSLVKEIEYLFSRINWGASFLDAKAITIMNELPKKIRDLEKQCAEAKKRG